MAFLIRLVLFIVRTSSVCLVLNFHPKWDAETKLQRRTGEAKPCGGCIEVLHISSSKGKDTPRFLLKNQKTTNGRTGNATRMTVSDYVQMHAFSMKAEGKA